MLSLFLTFFKIGIFSFGGGYAMIPVIEYEVLEKEWVSADVFTDMIAIASMSPGPIATNTAIFIGYETIGIGGAIAAVLGVSMPSLLLIILLGSLFYKIKDHAVTKAVLYGLRPVITAFIFYAAIRFSLTNYIHDVKMPAIALGLLLTVLALILLIYRKVHPLVLIVSFGLLGVFGGSILVNH